LKKKKKKKKKSTPNEIRRREDMVNVLANRRNQLEYMSKAVVEATATDREQLFAGQANGANSSTRRWGAPSETEQTRQMNNRELLQHQRDRTQDQNRDLEALGETVGRQKELAFAIGDELDVHVGLLDDIDDAVIDTTHRVRGETERVMSVSDKAKTGGLLICIVIQIIVLIVILFVL
jgi:SNARE domain